MVDRYRFADFKSATSLQGYPHVVYVCFRKDQPMKLAVFLPVMAVIASSAISAQQVTDFRQPGDVIRLEIKFDGTDAAKVKQILVSISKQGSGPSTDQIGFNTSF